MVTSVSIDLPNLMWIVDSLIENNVGETEKLQIQSIPSQTSTNVQPTDVLNQNV
jgi:hypothetical protein